MHQLSWVLLLRVSYSEAIKVSAGSTTTSGLSSEGESVLTHLLFEGAYTLQVGGQKTSASYWLLAGGLHQFFAICVADRSV